MCCFNKRKTPIKVMTGISIVIFVLGLTMTGLAINFAAGKTFFTVLNDETDIQGQDAALERFKNTSFGYLLGAGVLGITTGFFGFFFKCCKRRCYNVFYGTILTVTWIAMCIFGGIVTSVGYGAPKGLQEFCDGTLGTSTLSSFVVG